jgi:hypothetical protein
MYMHKLLFHRLLPLANGVHALANTGPAVCHIWHNLNAEVMTLLPKGGSGAIIATATEQRSKSVQQLQDTTQVLLVASSRSTMSDCEIDPEYIPVIV